ncbi:MAG: hypothetical protein ABI602_01615 [Candidatus Saccharibacteria bacterium]
MEYEFRAPVEAETSNHAAQAALGLIRNKWALCVRELGFASLDDPAVPQSVALTTPGGIKLTLHKPEHNPFHSDPARRSDPADINSAHVSYQAGETVYTLRVSQIIDPYVVVSKGERFVVAQMPAAELIQAVTEGELSRQ